MSETMDWPTKSEFPYRALIRIRYEHELDVLLVRQLQHAIHATASRRVSTMFEDVTTKIAIGRLGSEQLAISDAQRGAAFVAFDPDGPLCPDTPQERIAALIAWLLAHGVQPPPPPPDPDPVYLRGDLAMVVLAARDAVSTVASSQVAEQLHGALNQVVDAALRTELPPGQRSSVSV